MRQCRIVRAIEIFTTRTYERAVKKLISASTRREMETAIAADPTAAPVIPGTGGIRKLRWSGSGRGKRGGIQTIYFHHTGPETIYLLTADEPVKSEQIAFSTVAPKDAPRHLLRHSFVIPKYFKEFLNRQFSMLCQLTSSIPVQFLEFPRDLDRLSQVVDAIWVTSIPIS